MSEPLYPAFLARKEKDSGYEYYPKGCLVWFYDPTIIEDDGSKILYRPGKVKTSFSNDATEENNGVVLYKEDGVVKEFNVGDNAIVVPMGTDNLECLSHISMDLVDLSEPALFHNLLLRFAKGCHYMTVFDNILLFLNQTFETDQLTLSMAKDEDCSSNLGTVVERAFRRLHDSSGKDSSSIVINGARGTGKRDVTRFVLRSAIAAAKPTKLDWYDQLMASDLLLQVFGGDDGFLKWTEIQMFYPKTKKTGGFFGFGKGTSKQQENGPAQLLGAVYNAFGLQDSRITNTEYQIFPIFSCLFSDEAREQFSVINAKDSYLYMTRDVDNNKQKSAEKLSGSCEEDGCSKPQVGDGFCIEHTLTVFEPSELQEVERNQITASRAWHEIMKGLKTLNMSSETIQDLVHTLVGILDVGNIEFQEFAKDVDDDVKAAQEAEQEKEDGEKQILGVLLRDLRRAFKIKRLVVKKEVFLKERPYKEKYAVRDGLARILYSALFNYVISTTNQQIGCIDEVVQSAMMTEDDILGVTNEEDGKKKKKKDKSKSKSKGSVGIVGVLETAALQSKKSSLDELYGNYRLERFHSFFSDRIVELNAKDLQGKYGFKNLTFSAGNEICVKLLMNTSVAGFEAVQRTKAFLKRVSSPRRNNASHTGLGILQLVTEEINLPGGNDKGLIRKIRNLCKKQGHYLSYSGNEFTVVHYGGKVTYDMVGFVEKSRANLVPMQLLELLREKSKNSVVRAILSTRGGSLKQSGVMGKTNDLDSVLDTAAKVEHTEEGEERRGNVDIAKQIGTEMDRAILILEKTHAEYVFTVAPNRLKDPEEQFDAEFLLGQIKSIGLSNICHRLYNCIRNGIENEDFLRKYGPLHENTHCKKTDKSLVQLCQTLNKVGFIKGTWEQRREKTFVNSKSYFTLETALTLLQEDTAVTLQREFRRFLARMELIRLKHEDILEDLEISIEDSSKEDIKKALAEAEKWKLRHHLVSLGGKRLERIDKEGGIIADLEKAIESKKCTQLYRVLQQAEEVGMSGLDFPLISKGITVLKTLENSMVTKEDKVELEQRFANVANELHQLRKRRADTTHSSKTVADSLKTE